VSCILGLYITLSLFFNMSVVVDKRERKLPSLLVSGSATPACRESWNEFARVRYRLKRLKEEKPEVYVCLLKKFFGVLDEFKQVVEIDKN
jgi:hypothetical protein